MSEADLEEKINTAGTNNARNVTKTLPSHMTVMVEQKYRVK
jgi:hypothetical protein